jgi:ribonuclease T1
MRALLALLALSLAAIAFPSQAQRESAPALAGKEIAAHDLPREARDTLALVKKGGPYPHAKDGTVFGNREARLPKQKRGYYREYTVRTPGARRIVAGPPGEYWYTGDHYATFRRIRE